MTLEQAGGFSIVEVDGLQYAIVQALADGFCLAMPINNVDSLISDVKIIKT